MTKQKRVTIKGISASALNFWKFYALPPPSNTTYISCSSQNEMIECCSQEVTAAIVREMKESQIYANMADEARDGRMEQLALCVRYVSVEGVVKERFLALTEMPTFDAASINTAISCKRRELSG